jgi:hypothetical protein
LGLGLPNLTDLDALESGDGMKACHNISGLAFGLISIDSRFST